MPLNIGPGVEQWIRDHQATPLSDETYLPPDFYLSTTAVLVADEHGRPVRNEVLYDKVTGQIVDLVPMAGGIVPEPPASTKKPGIIDIRDRLPHNGPFPTRLLSAVTLLALHYDGADIDDDYDPIGLYMSEAQYHINLDWGGGAHGHGLEYHYCISRPGDIYLTQDEEALTWNATNANSYDLAIKVDSGPNTPMTHAQESSLAALLNWLCNERPEIPATHSGVFGHGELTAYGNLTSCPGGALLAFAQKYRAG